MGVDEREVSAADEIAENNTAPNETATDSKTEWLQVTQTQIEGADKREVEDIANIRDKNKTDTNKTAVDETVTDTVAENRHSCRRVGRIFCRKVSQQQTMQLSKSQQQKR